MAPALTRGATGMGADSHGTKLSWQGCCGKVVMIGALVLYVLISAALLMLVVAAGYEKSWKTGLLISLILVFWGCMGGCGLYWMRAERRREWRRKVDGLGDEAGRVKRGMGGRDSGLGPGGAEAEVGDDGTGSVQGVLGDGERVSLLDPNPNAATMAVAARAGAFSAW